MYPEQIKLSTGVLPHDVKGSCNKRWRNKSKEKGDELAGSLEQADSKFAYMTTVLSTLIPNVPSWFSRQSLDKPCGKGDATQVMSKVCLYDYCSVHSNSICSILAL